ncbi:MAG: hypothetical protein K2I17_02825, partial [Clostridia bacterium]|nr:hypothetical protein [Clostridia bacterium]
YNPTATVYTDTSLATIKSYLTVQATYTDSSTETLTSYKLEVDATDGKLVAGNNTLVISSNDDSQTITYQITGVVAKAVSTITLVRLNTGSTFKYPVTADDIKAAISSVSVQWNTGAPGNLDLSDLSVLTVSGTLNAGSAVPVTIGVSGTTATKAITIQIDKGDLDVSGITFAGDTVTYNGNNHSIAYSGTLPAGVNVEYDYNGTKQTAPWEFANAGTYNITLSFTHSDANYNAITATLPATLQIDKASYTMPTGYDTRKQATYTGSAISLPANWITGLDPDVTVTYCEADGTTPFADKTAVDTYTVKAVFSVTDPANYNVPAPVTLTFEITDKEVYDDSGLAFTVSGAEASGNNAYTATYDPNGTISFVLGGNLLDKDGAVVTPTLTYTYEKEVDGVWTGVSAADLADAGNYRVTVSVATGDATYADINDKVVTLTIEKADYDMSGISFSSKTEVYNGSDYTLAISGDLPAWITPSYSVDGQSGTTFSAAGTYDFTVSFTHTNDNYNPIDDMTATLTISDAVVVEIEAELEVTAYTTANTLDDLKASLTVTAIFNNGSTAEVEDYELSCNDLRDGGKFKAGNRSVTVTYKVGDEQFIYVVNNILVSPEKVALPTFKGGLNYTGVSLKPTVENFNGYDSALMTFVVDKTVPGLTVGSYKAVFALNDPENYEWATVTTLKKALFAVTYDEMVLNANEAAVDWNISKAVLTATKSDGALPVFASESYIGAFADVVTLKYYKDEACTEEIAAADLAYETTYFVKAELLDTDNFELDASAAALSVKPFSYTTPAKELTTWDKIVRFLKTNWLWLVIAVVALILFIIVIALIARAAKKKRERAELAEQRRLEKEEREREERKLEREERMARLSQQQSMPQMMMPQMMPQMMGQMPQMQAPQSQPAAQPAAGGGMVTEAQFMQVQAELAALKAAQENAKEVAELRAEAIRSEAALRAEAALRNDINALRAGGGQDITGGMTAATLVEIVTAAMEKVL